ncbi:MAG: hypothetical protein AAGF88_01135 [Pseudomonadota bacterium]
MAAPIAPIAGIALKYAAVLACGYLIARRLPERAPDPRADGAMDDMADGFAASADENTVRAGMRWRRAVKIGAVGARIDAAVLTRFRVTRA